MVLTIWQNIAGWLPKEVSQAILWSILTILTAVLVYLVLSGKIISAESPRRTRHLLGLSILFVVLFALVRIWTGTMSPVIGGAGGRIRMLIEKSLWTVGMAAVIYILTTAARHGLTRGASTIEERHKIRRITSWIGIGIFVIAAGFIWASGIQNLGLFMGIVGAGLAMSLQETLLCIAGWLLLLVRRPFNIGDRIEIDNKVGDVIDISVFQTSMIEVGNWVEAEQSTGRMLIIPNSMLIRHPIYNYSKGFPFIWNELSVVVTFESDWQEAEKLMLEKAEIEADKIESEVKRRIEQMQARYAIRYKHLRPTVYTTIVDSGVKLTLRYISPVRQRRATAHRISRNILQTFLTHPRIDFAYPTTRFFRNPEEGKPGTGGPSDKQTPPTQPYN